MKQRITWIIPEDLEAIKNSCERDKAGNLIVPETIELYVKPTREEQLKMEIQRLEKELEGMKEPTKEELVEIGKAHDLYLDITMTIDRLKKELEKLK